LQRINYLLFLVSLNEYDPYSIGFRYKLKKGTSGEEKLTDILYSRVFKTKLGELTIAACYGNVWSKKKYIKSIHILGLSYDNGDSHYREGVLSSFSTYSEKFYKNSDNVTNEKLTEVMGEIKTYVGDDYKIYVYGPAIPNIPYVTIESLVVDPVNIYTNWDLWRDSGVIDDYIPNTDFIDYMTSQTPITGYVNTAKEEREKKKVKENRFSEEELKEFFTEEKK